MTASPILPGAAVAIVIAGQPGELLLIRRSVQPHDPWSGHVALPGGRIDPTDSSPLDTAIRETLEEVGVALQHNAFRTSLPPTEAFAQSARPRFAVTPHYFFVETRPALAPDPSEVAEAFWMPLGELRNPERHSFHLLKGPSGSQIAERRFPAIEYDGRVIWGLTYTILRQFIELFPALR